MKEVNKVSAGIIKYEYSSNYDALYQKIRMVLGTEAALFASVRISGGLIKWLVNDDAHYVSLKDASPQEKEVLLYLWNQKKEEIKAKLRKKSSDLEQVLTIPDTSFIFYREIGNEDDIPAHRYSILVTGWACSFASQDAGKDDTANDVILAPSTHQNVIVHFLDSEGLPIRNEAFVYKYIEKGVVRDVYSDSEGQRDQSICIIGSHFEYVYKKTNQSRSFEVLRNVIDYTLRFSPFVSVNVTVVDQHDVAQPKARIVAEYAGQSYSIDADGLGKASFDKVLYQGDGIHMHFEVEGQNCGDFEIRQSGNDFKLVIKTKEPFKPYLKVVRDGEPVADYVVKIQAQSMNASYKTNSDGVIDLSVSDGEVMTAESSENPELKKTYTINESQVEYIFDITPEEVVPVPPVPEPEKPSKHLKVVNAEGAPMPYYRLTLTHEGAPGSYLCNEEGLIALPQEWADMTYFDAKDEDTQYTQKYLLEENVYEYVFVIPSEKEKQNIYVRVVDQNSSVVPGYELIVKFDDETKEGITDDNGIFRIGEREVDSIFTVISKTDTSTYLTYTVEKGKDEYVFQIVVDPGPIYVTLLDRDKTPIPNANLTLTNQSDNTFSHYTDDEGTIVVPRSFFTDRQKVKVHTEIAGRDIRDCKFKYEKEMNHYYITLTNPFPWKHLLTLLALLLAFALLFVKCNKDVTITAVDRNGTPVEYADINYSYTESHLLKNGDWFYSNEHLMYGQTDNNGQVVFENLEYSVYSCIFHTFSKAFVAGQKDDMYGTGSYLFHWRKKYTLVMQAPPAGITIQVRSAATDLPIPGASVVLDVSDMKARQESLVTDANGECLLEVLDEDGTIDILLASKQGYSGNRLYEIDYDQIEDNYLIVYLEDIKRCSNQSADNYNGNQGDHAVLDYDMSVAGGVFKFSYYTDSAPDVISIYDGSSVEYSQGRAKRIFHFDGATYTTTFSPDFVEMVTFTSQTICVVVDNGTNWGYIVHCPENK